LGFRLFFFLAAAGSILSLLLWVPVYMGEFGLHTRFLPMQWHAREMVFGFTSAVIAGFLLTAEGNWTGLPMPAGHRLGLLAGLWLLGRITPFFTGLPVWGASLLDASFFLATAWMLATPLWKTRQLRNAPFPLCMLMLGAANVWSHVGGRNADGVGIGTELGLWICLLVVTMMGGRVIPGFTRGRIPGGSVHTSPRIEKVAAASLILAGAGHLAAWPLVIRGGLFAIAAGVHAYRAAGWFTPGIRREPLLWILHAAYAWLVLGLLIHALAVFGWISPLLPRHAFGAGALGSICLGMMCRVTLGHTGRSIQELPRGTVPAFALIQLAAALRVLLPMLIPSATLPGIQLSAFCWIAAYGVYFIQYAPMLFLPRVDGKAG
jgi:uncharacterized protein involved in response to NO